MLDYVSPDYSGSDYTSPAAGVPQQGDYTLPGDIADAQQMQGWTPAPAAQQGAPWWQGVALYGLTKAIDNQFPNSPTGVMGNVYPGSGAGWNGGTYTQRPTWAGGGPMSAQIGGSAGVAVHGNNTMLLVIGAVALFLLMK